MLLVSRRAFGRAARTLRRWPRRGHPRRCVSGTSFLRYNRANLGFEDLFSDDEASADGAAGNIPDAPDGGSDAAAADELDYSNLRKYLRPLLQRVHPDKLRGFPSSVQKLSLIHI